MTAPSNFIICAKNMTDYGTLTGTSEVATLPLSNLQNSKRSRVWRSTSLADQELKLTWEDTLSARINFVMLNRHNLEPAARWWVQGYQSYDWTGTPVIDNSWVNLCLYSNDFSSWNQVGSGSEVQDATFAGNTLTAWTLTDSDVGSTSYWYRQHAVAAFTPVAHSIRVRKEAATVYPFIGIDWNGTGTPRTAIVLNKATGDWVYYTGSVAADSVTIETDPNDEDYWKVTIVFTSDATLATLILVPAHNATGAGAGDITTQGSTVFAHAQCEQDDETHDITETTASSVRSGPLAVDIYTLGDLDWGIAPLGSSVFDGFLGQKHSVAYFAENTTAINSLKVTIRDPDNEQGYIEASRLYMGRGIELTYNPDTLSCKWDEDTKQDRSAGGSLMSDGAQPFRIMTADLGVVSNEQRGELMDMFRFAGKRLDVFASARPGVGGEEERDHTGIWRFQSLDDLSVLTYQLWKSRVQLTEA